MKDLEIWIVPNPENAQVLTQTSYCISDSSGEYDSMSADFSLNDLVGVWRRRSIVTEDGQIDTTTQVF